MLRMLTWQVLTGNLMCADTELQGDYQGDYFWQKGGGGAGKGCPRVRGTIKSGRQARTARAKA